MWLVRGGFYVIDDIELVKDNFLLIIVIIVIIFGYFRYK